MKTLRFIFVIAIVIHFAFFATSQGNVGINNDNSTPDASAILDVKSASLGILVPRMNTTQRNLISSPANGLLVFDTDVKNFFFFNGFISSWIEIRPDVSYLAGAGISIAGTTISNTGDINPADDITTGTNSGGDLSGTFSNLQIASNAVTTAEIADGTILQADLADNAVTKIKMADNAVGNAEMDDNAVGSSEVINGSIANIDLGTDAVNSGNIVQTMR
ncbi:MAG: hypothetical protein IPH57_16440 [Saprospiraceae bacterium]|nr:hypothetical protein [Saprospiraceae bacterium]